MIDSGWWTKVLFDEDGTVVDTDLLSAEDLPKHKHNLSDIGDIENVVKRVLEDFFIDHDETTVKFTYDDVDEKPVLTASVKIDDETIKMNEFGQLYVVGGASSSGSNESSIDFESFKLDIINSIEFPKQPDLEERHLGALDVKYDSKTNTIDLGVKIDGYTIKVNQDTDELYVDTQILADILGSTNLENSGSQECGNHKHKSSDITDFTEAVIELIKQNVTFEIDNLADLVDGSTIKVNKDGKLYSVGGSSSLKEHKHVLADISDWDNSWTTKAVLQSISYFIETLGVESLDTKYIDFENMSIGNALYAIDQHFVELDEINKSLKQRITRLEATSSDSNPALCMGMAHLDGVMTEAFYKKLSLDVEVYLQGSVKIIVPSFNFLGGTVHLVFDSVAQTKVLIDTLKVKQTSGIYTLSNLGDNSSPNLEVGLPVLAKQYDGAHTAYVVYTDTEGLEYRTPLFTFYSTPWRHLFFSEYKEELATHKAVNVQTHKAEDYYDIHDSHLVGEIIGVVDSKHEFYPKCVDPWTGTVTFEGDSLTNGIDLTKTITCQVMVEGLFGSNLESIQLSKKAEHSDKPFDFAALMSENKIEMLNDGNLAKAPYIIFNNRIRFYKTRTIGGKQYGYVTVETDKMFEHDSFKPVLEAEAKHDFILRSDYTNNGGDCFITAIGINNYERHSLAQSGVEFTSSKLIASTRYIKSYCKSLTIGSEPIDEYYDTNRHFTTFYFDSSLSEKLTVQDLLKAVLLP